VTQVLLLFIFFEVNIMSRFSRVFASGPFLRLASSTAAAAMFAGLLMLPSSAHAQGLLQSPSPNLTTGTTPQAVAAADFNRSGWTGLVVANSHVHGGASTISVFFGIGPNQFTGGSTYPVCAGPTAVLATDINHDGYADIIVACTGDATIDVLLNNGAGGFGTATSYYPLSGNPVALVAGDFVGKGYVDIASADSNGNVSILLNTTGNGTFATSHVTVGGTLSGVAAGDFNRDGHLDLAVSDSANNNIHVLANNGSGAFTQFGTYSTGANSKPSDIVAADFNQDGNIDVATSNAGTNTAIVLLGNGTGAFTANTPQATGTDPIALVTTDVNSDGYPDLVAFDELSGSTGAVAVLLGNGDGTLQVAQTSAQAFLPGTQAIVADFNRDGKPDIALTQQGNQKASVLLNNTLPTQYPDGRSFAAFNTLTNGMGNFADSVAVGDFNKDGKLDIAVSYMQDNDVRVLLGGGNGSFGAASTYAAGTQPYWIASGDLNGDGYPDLVTANTTLSASTGTISVLMNNKNGTFASAATYPVGNQPYQVAIGDLNGDGHPDLAVTNNAANTVSILFGSSAGTFTAQPTLSTCANPYGVAIGDFKHNGSPSVAVTCYASSQLEIFPNNGNGTFGSPFMYTVGNSINGLTPNPASIALGDFNRDGKLDIVVGNTTANNISFFAGNRDNTFNASVESPSLNFPDSIVAGDFNGDGILDIAGVAPVWNAVELTLGVGDGTFGSISQRAAGQLAMKTVPWALAAGDFNGDGQLDIVTANVDHVVNIATATGQWRYLTQFPANPSGNPSIGVLMNASAAQINLTTSPASPLPYNNSGVTINANVQAAYTGGTPTGSVIFENASGTMLGTGPYTLDAGGTASYPVGHLGSGTYLFTSLYSGDANYQPTTGSGTAFAVTVNGTPVTLSISPSSVGYGGTFTATVDVSGGATGLGRPAGTLTIYSSSGFTLGTITLTNQGTNDTGGTKTFTAVSPNLVPGSYNFYAVYTPTNGNYQIGSSSYAPLTITTAATTTTLACNYGFLTVDCTSTTTNNVTGAAVPSGLTVNFTVNGGAVTPKTTNASGQAHFTTGAFFGSFTVLASFPDQTYYQASSANSTVFCLIICGLDRTGQSGRFNSLTLFGQANQPAPFRMF
jgi:hypothetical protein